MRQPDICFCFGGRCWAQWCPNRSKRDKDIHVRPTTGYKHDKDPRKNKVLTLSESLAEMERNRNE